jgi:hypothetical protein
MDQHFDLLGLLHMIYGALILLVGLGVGLMMSGIGAASGDAEALTALGALGGGFGFIMAVFALPYILAGWGLRKRRRWARVLAMVVGALALLSIPIGTALGVYTFWALLKPEAEAAFAGDAYGA